jgi:hypothetical protein
MANIQIRFFWSGLIDGKIKEKREVRFGDFMLKQLPIPVLEPPIGRKCEVEYLFEYNGKQFTDCNNKKVHLYPDEILAILSFISHRLTKSIAWSYPSIPGGDGESKGDIEGLYGNIDWNNEVASNFISILKLDGEKRDSILRALVIYGQAINYLTVDITLGILFLCITVETLVTFVCHEQGKTRGEKFVNFILGYIPNNYLGELSKEYNFTLTGNEFNKYLKEIYGKYRSGFVHSGRAIAAHEYWLMKEVKTLFTKKDYMDDNGCRYSRQYVNLPLFEKIVWHAMKNYIKKLLVKNDEGR